MTQNSNSVSCGESPVKEKWRITFKGMKAEDIRRGFLNKLEYNLAKDEYTLTLHDEFLSLAYVIRDRLIERWILTQQEYYNQDAKRVYYLSLEFLLGRLLADAAMNLGIEETCREMIAEQGLSYEDILDQEPDAGLGNGGLGRLAACFLDSMATLELPAIGYGIRYEFGIFKQRIVNGSQVELPEEWLQYGNPWEIERPEYQLTIPFFGRVERDERGNLRAASRWVDTKDVIALPYDTPIPGYRNNTVNTLRLWAARSNRELDLEEFHSGDYIGACEQKLNSENISKVLYPNENNHSGKELRLKQQMFFTSASLQDIIRRFRRFHDSFDAFPDKVAIQLNDTHPAISIAELMRLLIDVYSLEWNRAWNIVQRTFAYTNHTLMPEALEKWPVSLMSHLLPRHMEIIYEINKDFLDGVEKRFPGDNRKLRAMSIIEEGQERFVRMAFLAIVGSHSVNGVARLHTELLANGLVKPFYEMWPEKFNNKTNGITPRRWLKKANPSLSRLITDAIGEGWARDLSMLKKLSPLADDAEFRRSWRDIKRENKKVLCDKLKKWENISLTPDALFDVQVKRIHEYKRQLLNILHCISLYNEIREGKTQGFLPRAFLFGGKAAPGYFMAKLIIRFINAVAHVINNDPAAKGLLSVHFIPNYRVTLAEYLIPGADVSEQISTAGTEASGTGNMKFALNGALTIGTLDGANIEIRQEVGAENIFIFGLTTHDIEKLRKRGYNPWDYYQKLPELRRVIDCIDSGFFSPDEPHRFAQIYHSLLDAGDPYMIMADFESYRQCHKTLAEAYADQESWSAMSIRNVANMATFSSDRTIHQYASEIWNISPVPVSLSR